MNWKTLVARAAAFLTLRAGAAHVIAVMAAAEDDLDNAQDVAYARFVATRGAASAILHREIETAEAMLASAYKRVDAILDADAVTNVRIAAEYKLRLAVMQMKKN